MNSYSVYLHIPFCRHRCGYCDFNTYAGLESRIPDYVDALCAEINYGASQAGSRLPVHTIFFGGGTPSLLSPSQVEKILGTLAQSFDLLPGCEISLEANPGTISLESLRALRSLGINRLSLGMQSSDSEELRLLERQHDFSDVVRAVSWARTAGFENINLDLIFGLPEQDLATWQTTLKSALGLKPEHLALYALSVEQGTPFAHRVDQGLMQLPDPDRAAEMYEWSSEHLSQAGFEQYEISNWAVPKTEGGIYACEHNLQYWRGLPYLGFGAGAHGYAGGSRTANVLAPAAYIRRCTNPDRTAAAPGVGMHAGFPRTPATVDFTVIDQAAEIGETMMMGLRLTREGISRRAFEKRFGAALESIFQQEIDQLVGLGLLEWAGEDRDALRLTHNGRLLGNQVFMRFI